MVLFLSAVKFSHILLCTALYIFHPNSITYFNTIIHTVNANQSINRELIPDISTYFGSYR